MFSAVHRQTIGGLIGVIDSHLRKVRRLANRGESLHRHLRDASPRRAVAPCALDVELFQELYVLVIPVARIQKLRVPKAEFVNHAGAEDVGLRQTHQAAYQADRAIEARDHARPANRVALLDRGLLEVVVAAVDRVF